MKNSEDKNSIYLNYEGIKDLVKKTSEDEEMLGYLKKIWHCISQTQVEDAVSLDDTKKLSKQLDEAQAELAKEKDKAKKLDDEVKMERIKSKELEDKFNKAQESNALLRTQINAAVQEKSEIHRNFTQSVEENKKLISQSRGSVHLPPSIKAVLERVRQDGELQARFIIDVKLSEAEFLANVISSLGQESGVSRLWDFYKERCEKNKRALDKEDVQVLEAALGWFNMCMVNPFIMQNAEVGETYNYEIHMAVAGTSGDKVKALWLPGIPRLKKKPFVDLI